MQFKLIQPVSHFVAKVFGQKKTGQKNAEPTKGASEKKKPSSPRTKQPSRKPTQQPQQDSKPETTRPRHRNRKKNTQAAPPPREIVKQIPSMEGWTPPEIEKNTDDSQEERVYFRDFDLHPRVLRALVDDLKFIYCTPIQAKALKPCLAGVDLAGRAQTGTGKTAAFLITILERFLADSSKRAANQPFALVLVPTRELAVQIDRDAEGLANYCEIKHMAVYGGMDHDEQRRKIESGVDLVAATPGRLLDYISRRVIDLSQAKVLVLDEADRMLDMGFIPDVRRIISRLPAASHRQTLLFSATLSSEILRMAKTWMHDPVLVEADPEQVVASGVKEIIYAASAKEKLPILLWLLEHEASSRVLIFRNRRRDVERLYDHLGRYGIECEMLSGDVPQKKRMRILEGFREGAIRIIVATDVAGRGIHVEGITHVVNYDLPYEAQDYVHRIGRTGRAGQEGRAISFACEERSFVIPDIEEFINRELPIKHPDPEMLVLPPPTHRHPDTPKKPKRTQPTRRRSSRPRRK